VNEVDQAPAGPDLAGPALADPLLADRALADELIDAMSSVRRAVRRLAGPVEETARLTNAQVQLVRVVRRRPGISVAEAAAEMGVAPNTVSTLVRQLVEAGLLSRRNDPGDRRVAHLSLAPRVAEAVGAWLEKRTAALAEAVAALAPEDRQALAGALRPLSRLALNLGRPDGPHLGEND
jgi:DNA-binding MarR family transcriptional regulator